jgi:Flp pilus assembly protein TadB
MTTLPSWAEADWANRVEEPFRSDAEFWSGLAASADAFITLVAAAAVAIALALTGHPGWAIVPFVVPAALIVRAAVIARTSSRRSQEAFDDHRTWRDAERAAVATSFGHVLRRRRATSRH